ncbi:innexin inx3-like [Hydractinia symbiolongicarpus]|uniref:innexin inx3-like n=1 Tax=Hydractinia symbiolongicarpus TaxID=13093 RepID=UPI00254E84ED|nr:innexin inx3-like [Hydractinia symbiolongicarpus]
MSFLASNIKSLLAIKIKTRHDSYTDQVSRIAVAKMFIVASVVMGIDWFHDTVACMPPQDTTLSDDFIHSSCWIKGFYVYPDMAKHMRSSGYYGIPKDLKDDGVWNTTGSLCSTESTMTYMRAACVPMQKHFFTQYQWMPFFVSSLSLVFYIPYLLFRVANTDMISLRLNLKNTTVDANVVLKNYFNHEINSVAKMRLRIFVNLLIKCLYVVVNIGSFVLLDLFLNHHYFNYGVQWIRWARDNTSLSMDFDRRTAPTPGNAMLPTFGMCDIHEARLDTVKAYKNRVKMICEISSNILYQYVFLVLWFVLIISITASCLGILLNIGGHVLTIACFCKNSKTARYVYKYLTLRECEYLEFIRRKDLALYGDVLRLLYQSKVTKVVDREKMLDDADGVEADRLVLASAPSNHPTPLMFRMHSIESNI